MLKKIFFIFFIFFTTQCSDLKKSIGLEKDVPDEFLVKKKQPLSFPPNYDLIPPDSISSKKEVKKDNSDFKSVINQELNPNSKNSEIKNNSVIGDLEKDILKNLENK